MDGIILLNKEKNISSRDYAYKAAKLLNEKSFGHTGTLDPLASGLLVVLLGNYTKLNQYINTDIKGYIVTLELGRTSDTYDITGNILEENSFEFTDLKIKEALDELKERTTQVPPIYSALKVNGKKLYHYARNNESVEIAEREAHIFDLEYLDHFVLNGTHYLKIRLEVSKGFYVRSFVSDLGKLLGCGALMTELVRYKAGKFDLNKASTLEDIKNNNYKLLEIEELFDDTDKINVNLFIAKKINNGLLLDERQNSGNKMLKVYYENRLIALYVPTGEKEYKVVWKDGDYLASLED